MQNIFINYLWVSCNVPYRTLFPFFPGPPSHPCTPFLQNAPSSTCIAHTLIESVQCFSGQPLKNNWVLPHPTLLSEPSTVKNYISESLSQFLSTSCLDCFVFFMGGGHRRLQCLSFSFMSLQSSIPLQKKLPWA